MAILRKKGTLGSQWQSLINSHKSKQCSKVWRSSYSDMPTLMQQPVQLAQKRNIGRNVYNKTFTHNVHNYNDYNENPKCDKSQQCRRNVIHCTQKKTFKQTAYT